MSRKASTVNGKIDKNKFYSDIVQRIKNSPSSEIEISATELAREYNVSGPSIDHHLKTLVERGKLALSPLQGRYNRKIYRLPTNQEMEDESVVSDSTEVNNDDMEKFKLFMEENLKKLKQDAPEEQEIKGEAIYHYEEPSNIIKTDEQLRKITPSDIEERRMTQYSEPTIEVISTLDTKELTLDDKIDKFLNETNRVHDANTLLNHEDREILSVMNETLNQTIVYFKDLSEQLSTVQNKELIQNLIDDRNRMQQEIIKLQEDAALARKQAEQTMTKYQIEPQRVRFMQQMIVSTIEDYLNLNNQSLALQRKTFFNKVSKEISDLAKYALHLEE